MATCPQVGTSLPLWGSAPGSVQGWTLTSFTRLPPPATASSRLTTSLVPAFRPASGGPSSRPASRISRTTWLLLPHSHEEIPVLARVAAAVNDQGPDAYAMLQAAAHLHGVRGLPRELDVVDVGLPPGCSRHAPHPDAPIGPVRLHVPAIDPRDITEARGVRCTTPVRTMGDLLLTLPREDAVSMLDAELHAGRLTPEALKRLIAALASRRGCRDGRL